VNLINGHEMTNSQPKSKTLKSSILCIRKNDAMETGMMEMTQNLNNVSMLEIAKQFYLS
jgi:hypothetical protein